MSAPQGLGHTPERLPAAARQYLSRGRAILAARLRGGTGLEPEPFAGKPRTFLGRMVAAEGPPATLPTVARMWGTGPVLYQGSLGACAAFATVAELIADPAGDRTIDPKVANAYGRNHYQRARVLSGWTPMPARTDPVQGSTLSSNLEAAQERGLIDGRRSIESVEDLAATVVEHGPVILALRWIPSFETVPKNGLMAYKPSTRDRGYHALAIVGYDPARAIPRPPMRRRRKRVPRPPLPPEPMVLIRNSWGTSWGELPRAKWNHKPWQNPPRTGSAWLRVRDLRHMWDSGEAYAYTPLTRFPVDLAALLEKHPDPTVS